MSAPRSPLRWRKVAKPEQWPFWNAMSQHIWSRDNDYGLAVELVRAGKVLATARMDGRWTANTLGGSGKAVGIEDAKIEASAFVKRALEAAKAGES